MRFVEDLTIHLPEFPSKILIYNSDLGFRMTESRKLENVPNPPQFPNTSTWAQTSRIYQIS